MHSITKNTIWPMAEKIYRLLLSFGIYAWMARSLGPESFGNLNYALSLLAFFEALSNLGLINIIKQEMIKIPKDSSIIIGSSLYLYFIGALISSIGLGLTYFFNHNILLLVFIPFYFFRVFDVWEHFLDATKRSIVVARYKIFSFSLISFFRIIILYLQCNLIIVALSFLLEPLILSLFYYYHFQKEKISKIRYDYKLMLHLIKRSWPIIFSSFAVLTYMKLDQIMLMHLTTSKEVGLYSAAVKLSEVWFFIPISLCNAFFPSIVSSYSIENSNKFEESLQKLHSILLYTFLLGVIILIPLSKIFIPLLFGEKYIPSINIFSVHIFSSLFIFFGQAQGIWDTCSNQIGYSFFRAAMGGLSNLILNFYMIPLWGVMGAAYATILSYSITFFWMNLIHPKNRTYLKLQLKSWKIYLN